MPRVALGFESSNEIDIVKLRMGTGFLLKSDGDYAGVDVDFREGSDMGLGFGTNSIESTPGS